VVPCRNCAAFISPCLDSVLAQEYTGWRLLVADDASTDATADAVRPYLADPRIAWRRLPAHGGLMANTREALARLAPGPAEVVAILDGDDTLLPGALARLMAEHARGCDVVWTDMEIEGRAGSTGRALLPGVPVRQQLWCLSQLRSFKGYLLRGLPPEYLCDPEGGPCRAAGDLALYFALIERAGAAKAAFVPEKLYRYREHAGNNCRARRAEQLANNRHLRALAPLPMQTEFFDFTETLPDPDGSALDKLGLREFGRAVRARYPEPYSVRVRHVVPRALADSWRAYHGLWIAEGIYLDGAEGGESADGTDAAAP
jgi:glycosyltransferase involved in cell wall biosynthesis